MSKKSWPRQSLEEKAWCTSAVTVMTRSICCSGQCSGSLPAINTETAVLSDFDEPKLLSHRNFLSDLSNWVLFSWQLLLYRWSAPGKRKSLSEFHKPNYELKKIENRVGRCRLSQSFWYKLTQAKRSILIKNTVSMFRSECMIVHESYGLLLTVDLY